MKFGRQLRSNTVGEWKDYYVNYKELKKLLETLSPPKEMGAVAAGGTSINAEARSVPILRKIRSTSSALLAGDTLGTAYDDDIPFLERVRKELGKANDFYLEELSKLSERLTLLLDDLRQHQRVATTATATETEDEEGDADARRGRWTMESIKRALRELYRRMVLLQNFAQLNHTAVLKIVKKHKKITRSDDSDFIANELPRFEVTRAGDLLKKISAIEDAYCHWYTGGDVLAARSALLAKQRIDYDWKMFHSGIHFGIVFVLLVWVLWDAIVDGMLHPDRYVIWGTQAFLVYRGLASMVVLMWCIGGNLFVWNKARINYLYIFTLDPESTATYPQMFTLACNVSIFFLTSFLLFTKIQRGDFPDWIPPAYFPAITFLLFIFVLILPLRTRLPLLKTLANLLRSPFVPVTFYTSYVADVLTSLVKPIVDIAFSLCFVFSGSWANPSFDINTTIVCTQGIAFSYIVTPVLIALPLWIRLMQCLRRYRDTHDRWPHLGNAGKYAVAQTVVLFGAFHPRFKTNTSSNGSFDIYQSLWVVSLVISTLYTYTWDVTMDWGLMKKGQKGLRSRLMFSKRVVYYLAIVADLFLRFAWTLTLLPNSFIPFLKTTAPLVDLFLAMLEVLRRTMWGFFRVEWEHLANTEHYRTIDFIPLHFDLHGKQHEEKYPGWRVALELSIIAAIVIGLAIAAALTR